MAPGAPGLLRLPDSLTKSYASNIKYLFAMAAICVCWEVPVEEVGLCEFPGGLFTKLSSGLLAFHRYNPNTFAALRFRLIAIEP